MKNKNTQEEIQIFHLTEEEKKNPQGVLRSFTEDISLAEVRNLITRMRDLCSTTSNTAYEDPKAREDLHFLTQKIIRFFEASYLQVRTVSIQFNMHGHHSRVLRVMEKEFFEKSKSGSHTVPSLHLFGAWLAAAGFIPGTYVQVISDHHYIFITQAEKWQQMTEAAQRRA